MTGVLIEKGNLDTDMPTGRMSCEDEGRDGRHLQLRNAKDYWQPPERERGMEGIQSPQKEPTLSAA